ncbi:MAG: hypothetical protein HZA67_02320 [Rhodospirillales bacterium]|nr:hypothetical protein [Rhodospirillales bacterium]
MTPAAGLLPSKLSFRAARELDTLPADCPAQCLGVNGDRCLYRRVDGVAWLLRWRGHNRRGLLALFGGNDAFLVRAWPKVDAAGNIKAGWNAEAAATVLMRACAAKGLIWPCFDRSGKITAWQDNQGRPIPLKFDGGRGS